MALHVCKNENHGHAREKYKVRNICNMSIVNIYLLPCETTLQHRLKNIRILEK